LEQPSALQSAPGKSLKPHLQQQPQQQHRVTAPLLLPKQQAGQHCMQHSMSCHGRDLQMQQQLVGLVVVARMLELVGGCYRGMRRVRWCCGSCGAFQSLQECQGHCSSWQ
jgi:hypothetical protein